MTEEALVEIGVAIFTVTVSASITAALAYAFIAIIEQNRKDNAK